MARKSAYNQGVYKCRAPIYTCRKKTRWSDEYAVLMMTRSIPFRPFPKAHTGTDAGVGLFAYVGSALSTETNYV